MSFKLGRILVLIAVFFSMSLVGFAQDDEVLGDDNFNDVDVYVYDDPDPNVLFDDSDDAAIEAITDNSEDYYGAVVTVDATVTNFLSPRIFEVGEQELLTNSRVLVVNNSSQAFPASMIEGTLVRVTGRVHPSYDVINNGYDWTYEPYGDAVVADDMAEGNMEGSRLNLVDFVQTGYIPGVFGQHTILEVLNIENVEIIGYDGLIATD